MKYHELLTLLAAAVLMLGVTAGCKQDPDDDGPAKYPVGDDDDDDDDNTGDDDDNTDDDDDDTYDGPCDFAYIDEFQLPPPQDPWAPEPWTQREWLLPGFGDGFIAHAEPPPDGTYQLQLNDDRDDSREITMPTYSDNMPLFERAVEWDAEEQRCYELPAGADWLNESQAYDLFKNIAELTTGISMDTTDGVRSVVGIRGAYPGTFVWHGNTPNLFNDTLVLLWQESGDKRVLEFAVHTDVGDYSFGYESSSSLRPDMRYHYINNWHGSYNALKINEWNYRVRNDTNNNGHWDDDRNGWLSPSGDDYDRTGGGHNIHMASVDAPLGTARVQNWSAGCQTIPGMDSWEQFITHAWTELNDPVNYFLVDTRDIPNPLWFPCTPDGSHDCPYEIGSLPYSHNGDTSAAVSSDYDLYNCSDADESGPEAVYVLTIDESGSLEVDVDCDDPVVDVDVHLLDGDDPDACLDRDHWGFSYSITPGQYFIIVDTWVDEGDVLEGDYTLTVSLN